MFKKNIKESLVNEYIEKENIADIENVQIANYNCPGQIVISGKKEAVEEAAETEDASEEPAETTEETDVEVDVEVDTDDAEAGDEAA